VLDDEPVVDVHDARRRPRGVDRGVVLDPRTHMARERDGVLVGIDRQGLGVDPGITREGC